MKLIIDINDNEYTGIKEYPNNITSYPVTIHIYDAVRNGTPLDDVKTEIERLKHQYTDVSGYRWWNNAIDNCLHTIRDVCDAESEDT